MLEAQKKDQWVPKVGSMIFVRRMKGNFKVILTIWAPPEALHDMQGSCMYVMCTQSCPSCLMSRAIHCQA